MNQIKELRSKLNKYPKSKVDFVRDNICLSDIIETDSLDSTTLELNNCSEGRLNITKYSTKFLKGYKGPKGFRSYSTKSCSNANSWAVSEDNNFRFPSYLAGLIEADGSFAIHDKDSKAKKYI